MTEGSQDPSVRPVTATYRLQLRGPPEGTSADDVPAFGFAEATALVDYLAALGVSHVYASPILEAFTGSTHNYDVIDPTKTATALGGPSGLDELVDTLRNRSMGLIVDIVPNHLGVARATANPWFADVLAHGRDSAYAHVFDIDWVQGEIALPVLGSPEDLQALEVHQPDKPHREGEAAELRFYEHAFPVAPGSLGGTPQQVHDRQHYRLVPWDEIGRASV